MQNFIMLICANWDENKYYPDFNRGNGMSTYTLIRVRYNDYILLSRQSVYIKNGQQ
jgi:hypothetical protein